MPIGPHLVPGGQDGDHGTAPHHQVGGPGGRRGGEIDGTQPVTLGQQQLGGAHVLADRAHVLEGRHRRPQLGGAADVVHVLAHDDRVAAVGHRVAGVHDVVGVRLQVDGVVSLPPRVSAARTAIPSMPAASKGGEERVAHTGSAVTRPAASSSATRSAGSRAGQPPAARRRARRRWRGRRERRG